LLSSKLLESILIHHEACFYRMGNGWRRTHNLQKMNVLPLLLLNEMTPQPSWMKFFQSYEASKPMLVNALIPWMVVSMPLMLALKEWIPASLSLRRMWVIFVGASTFLHHLHRFRVLLSLILRHVTPCIWLCFLSHYSLNFSYISVFGT